MDEGGAVDGQDDGCPKLDCVGRKQGNKIDKIAPH